MGKALVHKISVLWKYAVPSHFLAREKECIKIKGKFPYNEYNRYEMYRKKIRGKLQ